MDTKDNNHLAFPAKLPIAGSDLFAHFGGMTLRGYFAAKAMQGEMANPNVSQDAKSRAAWAYEVADAMLAARSGT